MKIKGFLWWWLGGRIIKAMCLCSPAFPAKMQMLLDQTNAAFNAKDPVETWRLLQLLKAEKPPKVIHLP